MSLFFDLFLNLRGMCLIPQGWRDAFSLIQKNRTFVLSFGIGRRAFEIARSADVAGNSFEYVRLWCTIIFIFIIAVLLSNLAVKQSSIVFLRHQLTLVGYFYSF